jgi:thiaminase (transcriptional activator TenA)
MMLETRSRRASQVLLEAGAATWERAIGHPMVRAIGDGSLAHETFRGYFEQNVLYLMDYARAIALTLAKAPDLDAMTTLGHFLRQIADSEIPANLRFLERLGGDPEVVGSTGSMLPTNYAYTRHLLSVCAQGDCAEGLTAVLPCQWSYGELARPLMERTPEDPIYADWIGMFGNAEYEATVAESTALLDRLTDAGDASRMAVLVKIFERSTDFEVAFWDMAYGGPGTG